MDSDAQAAFVEDISYAGFRRCGYRRGHCRPTAPPGHRTASPRHRLQKVLQTHHQQGLRSRLITSGQGARRHTTAKGCSMQLSVRFWQKLGGTAGWAAAEGTGCHGARDPAPPDGTSSKGTDSGVGPRFPRYTECLLRVHLGSETRLGVACPTATSPITRCPCGKALRLRSPVC